MHARLDLLTNAAAGDFDGAYARFKESIFQLSRDYLTPRIVSLFAFADLRLKKRGASFYDVVNKTCPSTCLRCAS